MQHIGMKVLSGGGVFGASGLAALFFGALA
jgi:hypothetical protein